MSVPRNLVCHYNPTVVAAALGVSLLGALTSTQLMSQARNARTFPSIVIWTVLGCLTFGFCGVWCLHFLGMLSCEFDVAIGLNPLLTILSAVIAVVFTFGALSTHLVQEYQRRLVPKHFDVEGLGTAVDHHLGPELGRRESLERSLRSSLELSRSRSRTDSATFTTGNGPSEWTGDGDIHDGTSSIGVSIELERPLLDSNHSYGLHSSIDFSTAMPQSRSVLYNALHESGTMRTSRQRKNISSARSAPALNVLLMTANALINGLTFANVVKGFVWSIALTNMHFMGVKAMDIPGGFVSLDPLRVLLCALISWSVCCVGVILMAGMEVNLKQQVVFSIVAATGVAAVHFSGMYACSFSSTEAPTSSTSYPIELPVTIASVALLTCLASTGLLAHSATVARNKLTDVLYTRRRLWAAITQKENAESAAAAKGQFIASASHEIRTPLHQLQGYADLLAKSELSEEDRRLLHAIQLATRSLAMITSNVLDWSRLESGEAICRPVAVDIRNACESVVHVLPNNENNTETELIVLVAPEVPISVVIDETYVQRILMNLLSNSLKFTACGYVMLLIRLTNGVLHVTVEDSGCGIPKSFQPQLFEPYKQVQARGAERGTGLGLSIAKRLLERMQGSITVESKYQQDPGVGVANSGSVFSLAIPIADLESSSSDLPLNPLQGVRVFIMHDGKSRAIEGFIVAWKLFGAEVCATEGVMDITSDNDIIIWADLGVLQKRHDIYSHMIRQQTRRFLIPYSDRALLEEVLGPTPPRNVVPIRKPLIWHSIVQTVLDIREIQGAQELDNGAKAGSAICATRSTTGNMRVSANESRKQAPRVGKRTILLVEDNKINQQLGAKMLKMLKYDVLLAQDGQEAIDVVMKYSRTIDAILMDQSMPRKDGITATREIRGLEALGHLVGRQTIIAVTAAAGPEAQAQFLEAGTDIFLSKPLSLAKLEQTLSACFGE